MIVGRTTARLATRSSTTPSIAVATPRRMKVISSTLPKEWASGRKRSCLSVGPRMFSSAMDSPSKIQLSWVSITPLGLPVVPEV